MVDLSIIEQKIKDDPEIDQSVKDTLPKEKRTDFVKNKMLEIENQYST